MRHSWRTEFWGVVLESATDDVDPNLSFGDVVQDLCTRSAGPTQELYGLL